MPEINKIYNGDCIELTKRWPECSFDHCVTDPPFNISKTRGLGWPFSSHVIMQERWDRFSKDQFFQFNLDWLNEVCRVVKPNGNILVFSEPTTTSISLASFFRTYSTKNPQFSHLVQAQRAAKYNS